MATLLTQYENYLKDNNLDVGDLTYDFWLFNIYNQKLQPFVSDDFQIGPEGAYEHKDEEITLKPEGKNRYLVYYNTTCLGAFSMDIDGYYYYWTNNNSGCWNSNALRMIADALDKINKPYDDYIKENLK